MMRSRKPAAIAAAMALLAAAPGARADLAPPRLDGCAARPIGSPCFVDGETRGVCAEQILTFPNGNQHREVVCRVAAPGVDPGAPAPGSASASAAASASATAPAAAPVTAPAPAAASVTAPAPAPAPRAASCAAGEGGQGTGRGLAAAMAAAALVIAGAARRRAARRRAH